MQSRCNYGLIPVPPHLRHLTILSPFLRVPFPSQFLHVCFFSPVFFHTEPSKVAHRFSPICFKGYTRNPNHHPNDRTVTARSMEDAAHREPRSKA
jgi:hypothetical protein